MILVRLLGQDCLWLRLFCTPEGRTALDLYDSRCLFFGDGSGGLDQVSGGDCITGCNISAFRVVLVCITIFFLVDEILVMPCGLLACVPPRAGLLRSRSRQFANSPL